MKNPLNKEESDLHSEGQTQIETYIPDEITKNREDIRQKAGELIYPKDKIGEIVRLSDETEKLKQNQLATIQSLEAGEMPNQIPMHDKVAEKLNEIQMLQLKSMENIIKAKEKEEINKTKAENLDAAKEVSKFNQERLVNYAKAGGKAVGKLAKYIGIGVGAITLWITKFGLEITKETFKAGADIWYSLWGAHRDYRERYPNQDNI